MRNVDRAQVCKQIRQIFKYVYIDFSIFSSQVHGLIYPDLILLLEKLLEKYIMGKQFFLFFIFLFKHFAF